MVDIEKEGYDLSSELFSFKEMRRGIIEHGKTCYIEGYKKHAELFYSFLVKNGYFSNAELDKILNEFKLFSERGPELDLETAEKYLQTRDIFAKFGKERAKIPFPQLTYTQKEIFNCYVQLNNENNVLKIRKGRNKGVTTILKIIAQIEALNGKKVLYAGYGPSDAILNQIKNITYKELHSFSILSGNQLKGKKYDLIIIDEFIEVKNPYKSYDDLCMALCDGGNMIIVGTPPNRSSSNYMAIKDFFEDTQLNMLEYHTIPCEADAIRANEYPNHRNEILGMF